MRKTITKNAKMLLCFFMMAMSSVAFAFPTPTTNYKNLNVIDTVQVNLQMTETEGGWVVCDISQLLTLTNTEIADAQANIGSIMNMWKYDTSQEAEDYYVADELWPMSTWGYWWFSFADDEQTTFVASDWSDKCWGWTGGNVALGSDSVCWIFYGPYNSAKVGQKVHSQLYAIIGNDAILYNLDVEIIGATLRTLDECSLVGEMTVYTNNQISNGWNGRVARFELQEVLTTLGCGTADIQFYALDADSCLNPNFTSNAGFWMTMDGEIAPYEYGTKTWFAELNSANSSFNVGHMPESFIGDGSETCTGSFYIGFYDHIYKINIVMDVIPDRVMPSVFTEAGGEELYLQAQANYYDWSCGYNVDVDYERAAELTECALGDELVLYAWTADGYWSKACTVTTPSGFWLTPDGFHTGYDQNSAFFIENVYKGHIGNWGHMAGADEPGTSYTGNFYLVNEANGKYYTITYRVDFMSEIIEKQVVGEEDIIVKAGSLEDAYTKIDVETMLSALGIEGTEVPEEILWLTPGFGGIYENTKCEGAGYYYDANAKTIDPTDAEALENALFYITYSEDEGYASFMSHEVLEMPADTSYSIKVAAELGGKQYIYNITVISDTNTAINNVMISNSSSKVYNLNGQVVSNYHGVVIKDGKKYFAK